MFWNVSSSQALGLWLANGVKPMKDMWKFVLFGAAAIAVTGCNTVEGVGQDVEEVGSEIEETANNNK